MVSIIYDWLLDRTLSINALERLDGPSVTNYRKQA